MKTTGSFNDHSNWPRLSHFPVQAKALATAILLMLSLGMMGAMGQIIVHDIIPTFFSSTGADHSDMAMPTTDEKSGDLFSDLPDAPVPAAEEPERKVDREQFVWLLKWTHIHLFGMNIIFILLGGVTIFLNVGSVFKAWLVVLPFVGVVVDIGAMWLKAYFSPVFFWLHVPGGGLFGVVFLYVFFRGMSEMWGGKQDA